MSAIGGLYDFFYVPLLLPTATVEALLPDGARLLPIPHSILTSLVGPQDATSSSSSTNTHLVALQLGYQRGTGPLLLPFGMNFSEAKLEVPYVSHPYLTLPSTEPEASPAFLLKQTILFSSAMLSAPSNLIAGLKSHNVAFTPAKRSVPFDVPADSADQVTYGAEGFLDAVLSPVVEGAGPALEENKATLEALTTLLHAEWFGHRTGRTVTRFEYARLSPSLPPAATSSSKAIKRDAEIAPRRYTLDAGKLHLGAFLPSQKVGKSEEGGGGGGGGGAAGRQVIEIPKGTKAWRVRAQYRSFARSV
ncbi:hypothetical protein OC834_005976 [Tilletia horrida]|nr:hypothetical protein OC834_005976 [Tilletia horrida]